MTNNIQSRKYLLTINNPNEHGFTHEHIRRLLLQSNPHYFCMVDEIGESGTYHTHIFIYSRSPIRWTTLKKRFDTAHIDVARGTVRQNVEYLKKEGRWTGSDKQETNLPDTFEEYGEMPTERQESTPEFAELIEAIDEGKTTAEIVREHPRHALKTARINELRETLLSAKYSGIKRELTVIYLFTQTDADLIGYIYSRHDPNDICRVTDYGRNGRTNFDNYHGQSVLVFDNFYSGVAIEFLNACLSGYPCELTARYSNRPAAYIIVYFVSTIPLEKQYAFLSCEKDIMLRRFRNAFCRVVEFRDDGEVVETDIGSTPEASK